MYLYLKCCDTYFSPHLYFSYTFVRTNAHSLSDLLRSVKFGFVHNIYSIFVSFHFTCSNLAPMFRFRNSRLNEIDLLEYWNEPKFFSSFLFFRLEFSENGSKRKYRTTKKINLKWNKVLHFDCFCSIDQHRHLSLVCFGPSKSSWLSYVELGIQSIDPRPIQSRNHPFLPFQLWASIGSYPIDFEWCWFFLASGGVLVSINGLSLKLGICRNQQKKWRHTLTISRPKWECDKRIGKWNLI